MHATLDLARRARARPLRGVAAFLDSLGLLRPAHDDALIALADILTPTSPRRGEALWRDGDPADRVVVVRSGVVQLTRTMSDHEVTLDICGRGCVLGLAAGQRHHTATVHEEGTMLVVDRADFDRWLTAHPEVAPAMVALGGRVADRLARRLTLVSMHGARSRLALLLLDLAERFGVRDSRGVIVDVRLTHREMAALIGATRETVSVAIVELRKAGIIATESRRVVVVDEAALAQAAGL